MFEPKGKIKTTVFLRHIELLGQSSSDLIVDGFKKTERELIKQFTADTAEMINCNEWGVGLEDLLNNIYEIGFALDRKAINLAKDARKACDLNYKDWIFIEELVK